MRSGAVTLVELNGEHGLARHEPLKDALDTAGARRQHVVIDLSRVEVMHLAEVLRIYASLEAALADISAPIQGVAEDVV